MVRNFESWLKQLELELRWLPATKRREIVTELRGDLAEAHNLPESSGLAVEILAAELRKTEADKGKRALAFIIDFFLSVFTSVLAIILIALVPEPNGVWWLVILPLTLLAVGTAILWFPFFEATVGRTPGKMALGLAVISEDGRPCSWGQDFSC